MAKGFGILDLMRMQVVPSVPLAAATPARSGFVVWDHIDGPARDR